METKKKTCATAEKAEDKSRKEELKQTLVRKIKAKYEKEYKGDGRTLEDVIKSEVERFMAKSEFTQQNLIQLDRRIKSLLEPQPKKFPKEMQGPESKLKAQSPSPRSVAASSSKPMSPRCASIWETLVQYNSKQYLADQQDYRGYVESTKRSLSSELSRQMEEKERRKRERERKEKELEALEVKRAMEREHKEIEKEVAKRWQVNSAIRDSYQAFVKSTMLDHKKLVQRSGTLDPAQDLKHEIEQIEKLKQELEKEVLLEDESKTRSKRVFAEVAKSIVDTKKMQEEERRKEAATEQKALAEQETMLRREQEHKEQMLKKQREYLLFLEGARLQSMRTLEKAVRDRSLSNEQKEAERAKRALLLEAKKEEYVKQAERDTKLALDRMVEEKKRKMSNEKSRDLKLMEQARKKFEEEAKAEKDKEERMRLAKLTHQKEIVKQIEEKQRRKAENSHTQEEMRINKDLIQRALEALNGSN